MPRQITLIAVIAVAAASNIASAQTILPGLGGSRVVPPMSGQYIPPSQGQYPIYVSENQITGINPETGGYDTYNRQIDNTVHQMGRNESQHNGTKRWVRRPVHNAYGQVVGYQEGYVWINSYTGQEHGELTNYTPNDVGGVNHQFHSQSALRGVHKNVQSTSQSTQGGVHKNVQSYSTQGGVHRNVQSKL